MWSLEWPMEPGLYLFYGGYKGEQPKFMLCDVWINKAGNVEVRVTNYGLRLYKSKYIGAFRPFDERPPSLDQIANPPKVTPEQIAALIPKAYYDELPEMEGEVQFELAMLLLEELTLPPEALDRLRELIEEKPMPDGVPPLLGRGHGSE
jgi:hypothetical protein